MQGVVQGPFAWLQVVLAQNKGQLLQSPPFNLVVCVCLCWWFWRLGSTSPVGCGNHRRRAHWKGVKVRFPKFRLLHAKVGRTGRRHKSRVERRGCNLVPSHKFPAKQKQSTLIPARNLISMLGRKALENFASLRTFFPSQGTTWLPATPVAPEPKPSDFGAQEPVDEGPSEGAKGLGTGHGAPFFEAVVVFCVAAHFWGKGTPEVRNLGRRFPS